jgi:hypothetical protein
MTLSSASIDGAHAHSRHGVAQPGDLSGEVTGVAPGNNVAIHISTVVAKP